MMGLLFGTTFLALGIMLGVWVCKRNAIDGPESGEKLGSYTRTETKQILEALKSFATWTSDFAGDFSLYKAKMNDLSHKASDANAFQTKEDVRGLLDQIVSANRELQARLDNAEVKLEQQTKQLAGYLNEARTDGLTGLANRRAFDQRIDECFKKWTDQKQVFSLALIDIDHFKKINDTFGHPAGDAVLKEVAVRLKDQGNDCLLIARYGGEEFALLFSTPVHAAAKHMERLRLSIAAKPIQAEGQLIKVTMSSGVSEIARDDRVGKIIRRSDEALYSAKMAGRNRVFIHTGKLCEVFGQPTAGEAMSPSAGMPSGQELVQTDPVEQRLLKEIDRLLAEERVR
jgi:diguanylate cyclase